MQRDPRLAAMRDSTNAAKRARSTASAPPAGTAHSRADVMMSDPSRASSSLSRPTAFSSAAPRNELLQTSSASAPDVWAGPLRFGRISYRSTSMPQRAACHAASQPASPPPITVSRSTVFRGLYFDGFFLVGRFRFDVVRAVGGALQASRSSAARLADDVRAADRAALHNHGIP